MKVYIVTVGSYSDYKIQRVFVCREKAEKYCLKCPNANDIEEFETDDEKIFHSYYKVAIQYGFKLNKFSIEFILDNYNDGDPSSYWNENRYSHYIHLGEEDGTEVLYLSRIIDKVILTDVDKEFYTLKYKKVCYDLMAQIKHMKEIEELNEHKINERLKGI